MGTYFLRERFKKNCRDFLNLKTFLFFENIQESFSTQRQRLPVLRTSFSLRTIFNYIFCWQNRFFLIEYNMWIGGTNRWYSVQGMLMNEMVWVEKMGVCCQDRVVFLWFNGTKFSWQILKGERKMTGVCLNKSIRFRFEVKISGATILIALKLCMSQENGG